MTNTGKCKRPRRNPYGETVSRCMGFEFSMDDELAMLKAAKESAKFMEGFGKGERKAQIDLSHYIHLY